MKIFHKPFLFWKLILAFQGFLPIAHSKTRSNGNLWMRWMCRFMPWTWDVLTCSTENEKLLPTAFLWSVVLIEFWLHCGYPMLIRKPSIRRICWKIECFSHIWNTKFFGIWVWICKNCSLAYVFFRVNFIRYLQLHLKYLMRIQIFAIW